MLKRLIRAQKYGRMANAYDYFGPDEEDIAIASVAREFACSTWRRQYARSTVRFNTVEMQQRHRHRLGKGAQSAMQICQDAILSPLPKMLPLESPSV